MKKTIKTITKYALKNKQDKYLTDIQYGNLFFRDDICEAFLFKSKDKAKTMIEEYGIYSTNIVEVIINFSEGEITYGQD